MTARLQRPSITPTGGWSCAGCCSPSFSRPSSLHPTALAQSTAATVYGSVLDEQKAALPGATVTIRNLESGQPRSTTTDARGAFQSPALPPGKYEVAAELAGFGQLVRSDLSLTVAQEVTLALTLRVAALEEAVTVTAELPLVETTRSSLGTTITTNEIEELPIAGRNFATLAQLTPGVTSTAGSGISSAGQLTRNSTFLIDGLSNDDDSVAGQRGGFSVDAIKEFIVVSNSFSAEYGQSSGAIVSVVTRSGTNTINGRGVLLSPRRFMGRRHRGLEAGDAGAAQVEARTEGRRRILRRADSPQRRVLLRLGRVHRSASPRIW